MPSPLILILPILRKIVKFLKKNWEVAKPLIKKALTNEVKHAVAILRAEGLALMADLESQALDKEAKRVKWKEWARSRLLEAATNAQIKWGGQVRLRESALNLVHELIYQAYKEGLKK